MSAPRTRGTGRRVAAACSVSDHTGAQCVFTTRPRRDIHVLALCAQSSCSFKRQSPSHEDSGNTAVRNDVLYTRLQPYTVHQPVWSGSGKCNERQRLSPPRCSTASKGALNPPPPFRHCSAPPRTLVAPPPPPPSTRAPAALPSCAPPSSAARPAQRQVKVFADQIMRVCVLCVPTVFVAKAVPLPCVFTAFVARTVHLSCVPTAFVTKTVPLPCRYGYRLRLKPRERHCFRARKPAFR